LNRDGLKDMASVNWSTGDLTVSINNGGASFGAPLSYLLWEMPDDLTAGDFNGDGTVDVAICYSYYSLIYILLGGEDSLFSGYFEFGGGDTPISIVSSDLNNDGRLDLAVSSGSNSVSVFLNLGYDFARPSTFSVGQFPIDIAAGDLDGDGKSAWLRSIKVAAALRSCSAPRTQRLLHRLLRPHPRRQS
jgi:hypothetical protein